MEESRQDKIGTWKSLPNIPTENDISIGQRTVFHRGRIYAIFGLNNHIITKCYETGKILDCLAKIYIIIN